MDYLILILTASSACLLTVVFQALAPRRTVRIKLIIIGLMQFAYAGYGVAYQSDGPRYSLAFIVYLALLQCGVLVGSMVSPKSALDRSAVSPQEARLPWWSNRMTAMLAAVYIVASVGQLLVPPVRLFELFRPDLVLLDANQGIEIFLGRTSRAQNFGVSFLQYTKLISTPFFFVELQRRFEGRWIRVLLVLLSVTYIDITSAEQWGRATLLMPVLTWLVMLLFARRLSPVGFTGIVAAGLIFFVPLLNAVADWRRGVTDGASSLRLQLLRFQSEELSYPQYYPLTELMGAAGENISRAIVWLISLPVPSGLTGAGFSVSREFSEAVLGLQYATPGFYVVLPSWLGEAFMLFGGLFGVWGFIVGFVIGITDRFLSSRSELLWVNAYFTSLLIIYSRSVSQEYIAQTVNSLWLLLLLWFLRTISIRSRNSVMSGSLARGAEKRWRIDHV